MRLFLALAVCFAIVPQLTAQTFQAAGGAVPDDGTLIEFSLDVSGLVPSVLDTIEFGLEQVCLTATHTWIEDLDIWLVAPDGTDVLLTSFNGGSSDNYTNTCFRHDAEVPISLGTPPFTGTFRPFGQLGRINNGQNGNGIWKLRVLDTYPFADAGNIVEWSITFGNDPATYFTLLSSDLPIVVINTGGQQIPDEPKISATMAIVDNGPGQLNQAAGPYNDFHGSIGIERRGWSSSVAPKKSYGIELWDENGADMSASILGMPAEQDWILSANYYDKSFLNNTLTYTLARNMGHYAARHRHVEVILNGEYIGMYVFMEKLKRDNERIAIAKLDSSDIAGDAVTGGYIIKIDKSNNLNGTGWDSQFPPMASPFGQTIRYHYDYPKPDRIMPEQAEYIQEFVHAFESALNGPQFSDPDQGYAQYIDRLSFIDVFLLNELSRNVDGYRLSTFLHKQRDSEGGRLRMGPVWDYDIAWGNANYCDGSNISGWAYQFGQVCPSDYWQVPFWWDRFLQDPAFVYELNCRWMELKQEVLSITSLLQYCDSMELALHEAQQRNFHIWPILGTQVWPNPTPVPMTYAGEVQELRTFIQARWNWLDAAISSMSTECTVDLNDRITENDISPYPVPFLDHVNVHWNTLEMVQVAVFDPFGRTVIAQRIMLGTTPTRIDLPATLPAGGYLMRMISESGRVRSHRLLH